MWVFLAHTCYPEDNVHSLENISLSPQFARDEASQTVTLEERLTPRIVLHVDVNIRIHKFQEYLNPDIQGHKSLINHPRID